MQWLLIFKLVVLLTVANGFPVIAEKLFGRYFNQPLDGGVAFVDGRPGFWTLENDTRDHTFTCGGYRHRAPTRLCMDMRPRRSKCRDERRPIVELLEAAIKITTEQPRDRNRSNSRMFAPNYSNPFELLVWALWMSLQ